MWFLILTAPIVAMLAMYGPLAAVLGVAFLVSSLFVGARFGLGWYVAWSVAVISVVALLT